MKNKEIADRLRKFDKDPEFRWQQLTDLADELDPPQGWPPYGVPIELQNGKQWRLRISAGGGQYFDPVDAVRESISGWDGWRYMPVDWSRAPSWAMQYAVSSEGQTWWYSGGSGWEVGEKYGRATIIHVEDRPE